MDAISRQAWPEQCANHVIELNSKGKQMNDKSTYKKFKQWFDNWDFPIDIRNPLLKVEKPFRLYLLEDIAIQPWEQQQKTIDKLMKLLTQVSDINDSEIKEYGICDHSRQIKEIMTSIGIETPKEMADDQN